ncbi:MAG: RNA polymerase sigma-70 factor (ECF subfamily) [Salibacteraceae bacterium]|jgi:RNA polymerase sigma-70 factor (ECF subfamily)
MITTKNTLEVTTQTDEQLMVSIENGNKKAFDTLYARYEKKMFYFFFRKLNNNQEKSEDFLHDLFMKIIEKPDAFDTSKAFSPWFYSVAHNMVKNEYKKMDVRKVMDTESDTSHIVNRELNPMHSAEEQLFKQRLFEELSHINQDSSTAFIMKYHEGFSIEEIAKALNIKEGTVKSKLFYAKQVLSEKLEMFNPKN